MGTFAHVDTAASHVAWEGLVAEMAGIVKSLKASNSGKDEVDEAVQELLHRKRQFAASLEAAIAACGDDEAAAAALRAKLPPPPKPDKKAKKTEKQGEAAAAAKPKKEKAKAPKNGGEPAAPAAPAAPVAAPPPASGGGASPPMVGHLVLRCAAASLSGVLEPYERKGFVLVGAKTRGGGALLALRAPSQAAVEGGRRLADELRRSLPHCSALRASGSAEEALRWMSELGARELVQWETEGALEWAHSNCAEPLFGFHNNHSEAIWMSDLLAAGAAGAAAGARFCAQLRRDSYAAVLLPAGQAELFHSVERAATSWFALSEDAKLEQAGAYGHVDRKFTGYRNGKFREQLELRQTLDVGDVYPCPSTPASFGAALDTLLGTIDGWARQLLRHVARDVGADADFFDALLDPPPPTPTAAASAAAAAKASAAKASAADGEAPPPPLSHSLIRACRYDAASDGVYGSNVLCEAHNDVGFLTFDACASVAGLEVLRRSDGLWVPAEVAAPPADGALVVLVMVGDTLSRLTADYFAACRHRVVAPTAGPQRIGLPYLFRGRSDAVLNTRPTREAAAASGRVAHLAEMETTTIKELPAFDSAKSILRGWFRSSKRDE